MESDPPSTTVVTRIYSVTFNSLFNTTDIYTFTRSLASEQSERDTIRGNNWKSEIYVIVIPWVLGVYPNKTPVSRGSSPRVRAFCSDIPYGAVSTPMKQRNVVLDHVRVEHRRFHFSRKRQSQETGSYTVTISLGKKLFPMVAMLH